MPIAAPINQASTRWWFVGGALSISVFSVLSLSEFTKLVVNPLVIRSTDTLSVSEFNKDVVKPLTIIVNELLSIVEFTKTALTRLISSSDSISITENITALLNTVRLKISVIESLNVAENVKLVVNPLIIRLNESLSVLENVSALLNTARIKVNVFDSLSIAESVTANLILVGAALNVVKFELISIVEFVKFVVPILNRLVFETITVNEFVDGDLFYSKSAIPNYLRRYLNDVI